MTVHLSLHNATSQLTLDPFQQVTEGPGEVQHPLSLLNIIHPLTVSNGPVVTEISEERDGSIKGNDSFPKVHNYLYICMYEGPFVLCGKNTNVILCRQHINNNNINYIINWLLFCHFS